MDFTDDDIEAFLSSSLGSFEIGEKLGADYEIVEHLGCGAHAEVYKVKNTADGRYCVAKIPKDENASRQFENEVRVFNKLSSQPSNNHIVRGHPSILHEGLPVIIMEFLDGPTLQDRLEEKGPLSASEARKIVADVLRGLEALHACGIIHRDINPHNIKLLDRGAVLFDFSVAADLESETTAYGHTGTLGYMPPEANASQASDIYSVGVLLYRLVAGTLPSWGEGHTKPGSATDILQLHSRVSAHPLVAGVCLKALSPKSENRYTSASQMRHDLWLGAIVPRIRYARFRYDQSPRWQKLLLWAFVVLCVIAVVGVVHIFSRTDHSEAQAAISKIESLYSLNPSKCRQALKESHTDSAGTSEDLYVQAIDNTNRIEDKITSRKPLGVKFTTIKLSDITLPKGKTADSFKLTLTLNPLISPKGDKKHTFTLRKWSNGDYLCVGTAPTFNGVCEETNFEISIEAKIPGFMNNQKASYGPRRLPDIQPGPDGTLTLKNDAGMIVHVRFEGEYFQPPQEN